MQPTAQAVGGDRKVGKAPEGAKEKNDGKLLNNKYFTPNSLFLKDLALHPLLSL
jgi:hypothetical protein